MGRFDEGIRDLGGQQANNPAAPAGARQMASGGGRFSQGLQQWSEPDYASKATSWFSGQNREGTNNGWSNDFVKTFQSQWQQSLEQGNARSYFDTGKNPDATGVVTWDHETEDGTHQTFGDIYEKGRKVGNVYDMYDREVADMMMAPWVLDNDAQAAAFSSSDWKFGLKDEIDRTRKTRNETFEDSLKAMEFQGDVDKREKAFESFAGGKGDEALIAAGGGLGGGALTAGLLTAGAAATGTGIGAPVGGALIAGGTILGAASALLNQDAITEQAARAYEVSKMSFEENGALTGAFTTLGQVAGVGSKFITPTSNLAQGLYDYQGKGGVGDGESRFYRTDKEGGNAAPLWMRAVDVGATVVDSLLQFSNPVGIAAYTAQMSGTIAGEVGEIATSGKQFDYRTGSFNNIFTDDDGNFDASSAAAGIAKVGIDAVQLGMARGLANKATAMRAEVAGEAPQRTFIGRTLDRMRGGSLGAGEQTVERGGLRFVQKADGTIDAARGSRLGSFLAGTPGARVSMSILAPSEQLGLLSARVMGKRAAARQGGAYSADDFYKSATSLSLGEKKFTSALVNGFGEGYEEAIQAVLEPHSMGHTVDGGELASAFFYGTAAGVGMGLGTSYRTPSADERLFQMANLASIRATGAELDRNEWNDLSETEQRAQASLSRVEEEVLKSAFEKFRDGQATQQVAGVAGLAKLHDAIESKKASDLARATNRTDGAFVITQLENTPRLDANGNLLAGEIGMDSVVASGAQTAANLRNHVKGIEAQITGLQRELKKAQSATADPNDADAQVRVDAITAQIELAKRTVRMGRLLGLAVEEKVDAMTRTQSFAETQAEVDVTNTLLRQAYEGSLDYFGGELTDADKVALQRAASMVFARDPHDSAGSYQVLVPQISARLTETASHNVLEVSHAILTPLRGDYDGDKLRPLNQLILDETEFTSARAGMHYVGAGTSVAVGVPKYEKYLVEVLADSLRGDNVALATTADNVLVEVGRAIRNRYDGVIEADTLNRVLEGFFEQVRARNTKARQYLLDGLASEAGSQITSYARDNHSNEWLWIDQLLVSSMQRFQEAYAAHRPDLGASPNTDSGVAPIQQSLDVRKRLAERAATLGQTLGILSPGDSMFRKFQKLHYSSKNANVPTSMQDAGGMDLQEMADLYRELGQRVTASELDRLGAVDDISGSVYLQLRAIADDFAAQHDNVSAHEALVVVANLKVQNFEFQADGSIKDLNNTVSLAQMLLRQAVIKDQREKARILDFSPELQAKHAKLLAMTRPKSNENGHGAAQAFIEIVGSQQLYTLLGDEAMIFGPHQTVEQFVRYYTSLSTPARQRLYREDLKGEPAYLGSKRHPQSFPADMSDLVDAKGEAQASAYRFMVDAIVEAGNARISMDDRGNLSGDIARRSGDVSKNFRTAHASAREALREFAGGRNELNEELVAALLESNPDLARAVMNLIPNASAAAAFEVKGDQVFVANWVYQMFAMSDAKAAEMHYWRNLLITEWNAMGIPNQLAEEGEEGEEARRFDRLPRRMHRVMYRLAKANDGGVRYQKFVVKLMEAQDLDEFISWVNTFPGIKGEQAPFTAWIDDAAEFDADKAKGGWTTALQGAELREAIGVLRQRTDNLVGTLKEESLAWTKDVRTIAAIRRSWAGEGSTEDDRLAANFERAVDQASEWQQSVGPQVMLQQTIGALRGFYAQAHTKGKNPTNVAAPGTFEAVRDNAYGFVTNYERMLASLTSANISDVPANFSELAKDGMRLMDDHGRPVEWTKPTPQQLLDMLETKETRALARAILFPQVTEVGPTGQLSQRLLIGKGLTDLVNGGAYKTMFPKSGRLSAEAAMRYTSMVEGVSRKYGDTSFALQRAVNDLVIARTSMSNHVLSEYELEQMTTRAYYEVAQVLQAVGAKMLETKDDGTPALRGLLAEVKKQQRRIRTARALGMTQVEASEITDGVLDSMLQAREEQHRLSILELAKQADRDPDNIHIYEARADADQRMHDRFKEHIELIRTDDYVGQVVDMFSIVGDTTEQAAKKDAVLDFVRARMDLIQRVSSIKDLMAKVSSQLLDPNMRGQVALEDAEWETLSRAVIGVYLDEASRTSAAGVSVSPWPDADHKTDQKYFDTSWSYLVDALLDPDSQLAQAARDVHLLAGRAGAEVPLDSEVINLLGRTVLDHQRLGPWTGDIPRASMEANSRLDSSSAEAAIAGVGNSPKRQAAMIAATRRTTLDPVAEDYSTTRLSWFDINRPQSDEVSYDDNGTARSMAIGQLNGRFVSRVTAILPDGTEIDALREVPDTSRAWTGDDSVRHSGVGTVTVGRLQRAFARIAERRGVPVEALQLDVAFLHPDSMPADGAYANNVYYEGVSFELDADRHESLLATLWLAQDSISPAGQAAALDASKLGLSAFQVIDTATAAERIDAEANWRDDFGAMLRAKTSTLLEKNLGFGELDPQFYNAVYKDMKLRHFVRGTVDGQPVLWRAEQVLAAQRLGQALPEGAELWVPSDDALRTFLGEQGNQGVARIMTDQLEINPALIPTFRQVTEEQMRLFEAGIIGDTATLEETRLKHEARRSMLSVRVQLDAKQRNAFDARMTFLDGLQTEIHEHRASPGAQVGQDQEHGFNARRNLARAVRRGTEMLTAEDLTLHWARMGIPFGPRSIEENVLSKMLLRDLEAAAAADGQRTGWVFREGSAGSPSEGLLSQHSLDGTKERAYHVAPKDLVVIEVDSFGGNLDLAKKRAKWFADRGAIVMLGAGDGTADVRAELGVYMEELGYEPIVGSTHGYQPAEYGSRFQNQRARTSTLMATEGMSAKNRVAILNVQGLDIQENAAWVNDTLADGTANGRLRTVAVTANLVPTSAMAGFNVPATDAQIADVRARLQAMDDKAGRAFLKKLARGIDKDGKPKPVDQKQDEEFDAAFDRLMQRFNDHAGRVLPAEGDEFGMGDIIPLVDNTGQVLLYRHGHVALPRYEIDRHTAAMRPGTMDAAGFAVFPHKHEAAATIHTGTVVQFRQRAGFGLEVEMDMPLQVFGDKKQLEWNGMKYVLAPMKRDIELPSHGFFENWGIDMISDLDSLLSKEAVGDMVDNHRTAFAVFGIDFLPDVTEVFFPGRGTSGEAQRMTREILNAISVRKTQALSVEAADELIKSEAFLTQIRSMLPALPYGDEIAGDWAQRLADQTTPQNRITAGVLTYLMVSGTKPEDVLSSGGFNSGGWNDEQQSRLMPYLFTQIFDMAPLGSALRKEINERLNQQITNPRRDGTGYRLREDFQVEVNSGKPGKRLVGYLQFAEAHSSGDNPVRNGMAFDESQRAAVSAHSAAVAYGAIGAETPLVYDISRARAFAAAEGVTRFDPDVNDGGAWRMLTHVPKKDRAFENWRMQTPAEMMRRENARDAMLAFRVGIDQAKEYGWNDKQRATYDELRRSITDALRLKETQTELVDFWVRQILGQPHGESEDGRELGRVTGKGAVEAARDILWNVQRGYVPTLGAEVPALHLHDLQAIYRANKTHSKPWAPRQSMDGSTKKAVGWNAWVETALGSVLTSDNLFDPLYLLSLDGFMHSYQNAVDSLMDLPVSMSTLVNQNLVNEDLNDMLVSLEPGTNLVAKNPAMVDTVRSDLDMLLGGNRIMSGKFKHKAAPASEVAKRRDARRKWRKENGVPLPVDVSMRNFRKNGADFVDHGTNSNALVRILVNLRVGTALLNPQLYVSMGPEQWMRGALDQATNILTGDATTRTGALLGGYDGSIAKQLRELYHEMGGRSDFKSMVYGDLAYKRPHGENGPGRFEGWSERYAKLGSRVQDPTWGVRGTTLARRYVESALKELAADPLGNTLTPQLLIAELRTNPTYLKDNHPELHKIVSNRVADLRSLKQTTANQVLHGVVDPFINSNNAAVNTFGGVVLKVPLIFSTYLTNVMTTILGLQGLDQMTAMFFEGRKKSTLIGRIQAAIRGEEFSPEDDAEFDMSSVIDGINLSQAFIRGGLTHSALFAFGFAAGGLGLSGEDDEMKKRRRLSEAQGVGIIYNPLDRLENSFINKDAVYLDWLPAGLGSFLTGGQQGGEGAERSMGELHWMLRQFVSPIIGMEKFFETGDARHIKWGFEDAIGAFPLINTMSWHQASETFDLMADKAKGKEIEGDMPGQLNFLMQGVATYERMLFENSFVNQLYVSFDDWDRDPYKMPLRDSDGTLQRDIEGNVRPNDLATAPFVTEGPDGKMMVQTGYLGQRDRVTTLKVLTENRATLAGVFSLFSGQGDSQYWRYNMPIKTREIEKPTIDKDEAKAVIRQMSQSLGGQQLLTDDELAQIWKNEAAKAGRFVNWGMVDQAAATYLERLRLGKPVDMSLAPANPLLPSPMSILDQEGREALTKDGAAAVLRGLAARSLELHDPALRRLSIPYEMRQEIAADWTKELVQEGIDMGLDKTKATSRMKRIMYGPYGSDVLGLADLLFLKPEDGGISYQTKQTYAQQNTTYVMGPGGVPWATGIKRDAWSAVGLKPVSGLIRPEGDATTMDRAGNTVDLVNGMNTGLRALVPLDDSRNVPTDKEIGDAIIKAIEDAAAQQYTPFTPFKKTDGGSGYGYGGYGYRRYRRGGYGGYGGGGGGGGGYFQKMYALPDGITTYGNDVSFINTNTPSPRRAFVRRERVESSRGRLKQWQ